MNKTRFKVISKSTPQSPGPKSSTNLRAFFMPGGISIRGYHGLSKVLNWTPRKKQNKLMNEEYSRAYRKGNIVRSICFTFTLLNNSIGVNPVCANNRASRAVYNRLNCALNNMNEHQVNIPII